MLKIIVRKSQFDTSNMQANNPATKKQDDPTIGQLVQTVILQLNALFAAESLRRNIYIFKNLNERMELHIKVIAQQRKVMQILKSISLSRQKILGTTNTQTSEQDQKLLILKQAIQKCQLLQKVNVNRVKVKMQGDLELVRIKNRFGTDKLDFNMKKVVDSALKNIKHQFLQKNETSLLIEFQSNAAAIQSVQRIKAKLASLCKKGQLMGQENQSEKIEQKRQRAIESNQSICTQIEVNIQAKDAYQSLKISIAKMKKQRKQHQGYTNQYQNSYQNHAYNQFSPYSYQYGYNMPSYPYPMQSSYQNSQTYGNQNYNDQPIYYQNVLPFIRRAVETDSQDEYSPKDQGIKNRSNEVSKVRDEMSRIRLDSDNFPSIQQTKKPIKQQNSQNSQKINEK